MTSGRSRAAVIVLGLALLPTTGAADKPPVRTGAPATWADGPGDAQAFAERYRIAYRQKLAGDPLAAAGLDRLAEKPAGEQIAIRGRMQRGRLSPLTLRADERALLGKNGFAVLRRPDLPTFMGGYATIYGQHLPLYVTADSILYALHRSFDAILKQLERAVMVPELDALLVGMREELRRAPPSLARGDVDDFLATALSLLRDDHAPPITRSGDDEAVAHYEKLATAGAGLVAVKMGGVVRQEDFSQFIPRGHYTDSEVMRQYFRAIIWLGRIDFPFLTPAPPDSWEVNRRALDAALLMRRLVDARNLARWKKLDAFLSAFVGENDTLTLPEVDRAMTVLGVHDAAGLAAVSDDTIVTRLRGEGLGTQRISSHLLWAELDRPGPSRTPSAFALLGQRYTPDGDVGGQVVFDHIPARRMMPSPLDVGFAVLGNDVAGALLAGELATFRYARKLGALRAAGDAAPEAVRTASLYNLWLSALRALAPHGDLRDTTRLGLPAVAGTEPWVRRLLNTQLASWAELRHNTVAYVKQSYTFSEACDFPDAYVEPYPELWERIALYASKGKALVTGAALAKSLAGPLGAHFELLETTARQLGTMATKERRGERLSKEDLAFLNDAVGTHSEGGGCAPRTVPEGWYPKLFYDQANVFDYKPTIADVHTQPHDAGGNPVGNVLHVGTGPARPMVVVIDGCGQGARAGVYVGMVSSYYETITTGFDRLTDPRWAAALEKTPPPPDVPWMRDLIAR
jgi:hypothetical protein